MTEKSRLHRGPCPRCGACTYDGAGDICRPNQGYGDDPYCPGDEIDDEGYILVPTPEAIAEEQEYWKSTRSAALAQEDITVWLARRFAAKVTTRGSHYGVLTECVA